jgi:hypothetical protein
MDLLATAADALGDIALASGNQEQALQYFAAAAGSDSPVGRRAARSLVLLDLPRRPDAYLEARLGLDQQGYVIAEVSNPTPVTVRDVWFVIRYSGDQTQKGYGIQQAIPPQRRVVVSTGVGPLGDPDILGRFDVVIERADVAP